jgi:1-aminocyclopropane-1-carboxylate deaminase
VNINHSITEKVRLPILGDEPFCFDIKRDDLIDPIVSGNKWRKLKYNVLKAKERKQNGILTFGGAFSNHLIATSKACQLNGLKSVGIVRGDELTKESNRTLKMCSEFGMRLIFITRSAYKQRDDKSFLNELQTRYSHFFIVPEGGKNYYGVIGCQEILNEIDNNYDHIYLAGGTGTTAAGVLLSTPSCSEIHVVSALKGAFLTTDIEQQVQNVLFDSELTAEYMSRLKVHENAHFGGNGKVADELFNFMNAIFEKTGVKTEPIYTGKVLFEMDKNRKNGY